MLTHPRAPQLNRREGAVNNTLAIAFLYLLALGMLIFGVLGRKFLPPRYSYDGYFIQLLASNRSSLAPDRSYGNTAAIYRILHLAQNPTIVGFLGPLLMAFAVVLAMRQHGRITLHAAFLGAMSLATGGVFLAWYSKDIFVLLLISLPLLILLHRLNTAKSHLLILLPIAVYAYSFRTYWAAIGVAFVFLMFASGSLFTTRRENLRPARTLIASQFFLIAVCFVIPIFAGAPADYARTAVNNTRMSGIDAATAISRTFESGTPIATYANIFLTQLGLITPWPLTLTGSPFHLAFAIAIGAIWVPLILAMVRKWSSLDQTSRQVTLTLSSFLLAVLTVLAIFEPDYGSYLRHISPVLPLALALRIKLDLVSSRPASAPHESEGEL